MRELLVKVLTETRTIAVVGASPDPWKAAHTTPAYLQQAGYRILPVNPFADEVLGVKTVPLLADLTEPVDVVNVFRPSADCVPFASQAVEINAKVLWLQMGIASTEAREIAEAGGLTVIMNTCMSAAHSMLGIPARP